MKSFIVCLLLSPVMLFAQEVKINHKFNVFLFGEYGIAYELYQSGDYLFRVKASVDFSKNSEAEDRESENLSSSVADSFESTEINSSRVFFELSPQIVIDLYNSKFGKFYGGGGAILSYSYSASSSERSIWEEGDPELSRDNFEGENSSTYYGVGAELIFGAEANITENFGFFVETSLSAIYNIRSEDGNLNWISPPNHTESKSESSSSGWRVDLKYFSAGVKVAL